MTAFTIWLIGYLYTLGIERRLCDEREEPLELMDAVKLFLFWPCYLGQRGVFRPKPEPTDSDVLEMMAALESIANSTCCSDCQEAARVAKKALRIEE